MITLSGKIEMNKPVLLCLAGNLCSPSVFDRIQVPAFIQKIYVDYLRGDGPWDMEHMGQTLADMIQGWENTPVILAGYSAGGVLAISVACKIPERIAGLVLSNTGPCSVGHGNPGFAAELMERFEDEHYIREFLSSCFYRPISKTMEDSLWSYTRGVSGKAAYEVSKSLREVDYREALKAYHNPALIIHGRLDTRRRMDSVIMIQECLPQADTVLLDTGHTPMYEDAGGYQEVLLEWMKITAYYVEDNKVYSGRIIDIEAVTDKEYRFSIDSYGTCEGHYRISSGQIGKTVFLSEEEAHRSCYPGTSKV